MSGSEAGVAGVRRALMAGVYALLLASFYDLGWNTYIFAGGLSGRHKVLALLFASPSVTFPAMLGLVLALIARRRSRVIVATGGLLALWAACGAFAPWAWAYESAGDFTVPLNTTLNTVAVALVTAAALAALSVAVWRQPVAPGADADR